MSSLARSVSESPPPSAGGAPQHRSSLTPFGSPIELAHPTPDLQSLQGAYVQNVERLEERAERMSCSSSDLGEEIRKLQIEQKATDSRRASLIQQASGEPLIPPFAQRPRNVSTSSYANSIVEVNGAARFGGYSPYSPIGSLRSGSWSQISHSLSSGPGRTTSRRSSKFGMISTPEAPCESPKKDRTPEDNSSVQHTPRPRSRSNSSAIEGSITDEDTRDRRMKRLSTHRLPSDGSFSELYNQLAEANVRQSMEVTDRRIVSDTSFTDIYDQIAGEIKDTLDTSVIGAQERELKRQSVVGSPAQLLPVFNDTPQEESSKPDRLSEPPPPLPPQHRELPQKEIEAQEDYGINFSFGGSVREQPIQEREDDRTLRPLQIHAPHDEYNDDHEDRPLTAISQDTFQQAEGLFQDFDGTHYAGSMFSRFNSVREPSTQNGFPVEDPNRNSMLKALQEESVTSLVPPPEDGMVYYPAPVPRMLNLPQRISQAPNAAIMAKRKTQVIDALPEDARKSAYWLPQAPGQQSEPGTNADARQSRLNLNIATLPPQLRASVFFDPGSVQRDVEVKDGSAVRTLDDLLNASAMAPVSAFTDHPMAGKSGGHVYRKSNKARASTLNLAPPGMKKERKSSFLGFGRRSSVGSEAVLDGRRSVSPNRLSGAQFDDSALARGPDGEYAYGHSGRSTPALDPNGVYGDLRDHDGSDNESGVLVDEHDASGEDSDAEFGAPTTLLAEIDLRKREQKTRNRTAYTAFPDGMHATLLELDDVAQLQKAKRKQARVALAWEDPALKAAEEMQEEDDDDVPLGVIYANNKKIQQRVDRQRLANGQPLGLIEKKELEDNEPLSRRMLRLKGINPNTVIRGPPVAITNPDGGAESESEHEGETLKQRMQRLRDKKVLDDTISGFETRPVSTFSVDVLSQFGGDLGQKDKDAKNTAGLHSRNVSTGGLSAGSAPKSPGGGVLPPSRSLATTPGTPADDEDETLGQRRARLQRETLQQRRQSSMTLNALNTNPQMSAMNLADPNMIPTPARTPPPMLRASVSLADLLAANPVGNHEPRKVSNDMLLAAAPPTSLLAKDAEEKASRKARMRLSSADMLAPSQLRPNLARQASAGSGQGLYGLMPVNNAGGNGMYMNQQQMYGMWAQQQGSQGAAMMQLHQQGYGYPLTPNQHPAQSSYGYMGVQQSGQPSPYGAMSVNPLSVYGAQMQNAGGNYQQSTYGGGHLQQETFVDHKTRSRVDAWRQSVMPS